MFKLLFNPRKVTPNPQEMALARPGGIIRVEGDPSALDWFACSCIPMADASAWGDEEPRGNCVNCGAPADESVCSYCGTRHV